MSEPPIHQQIMRAVIGLGAFALLSWLLIEGRELNPTVLLVLLALILAMSGLGNLIPAITGHNGGDNP